jgi:hypothetical protein
VSSFQGEHVLHLTEIKPGPSTFHFLLEATAAAQSIMPIVLEGGVSIGQVGSVLSQALKLFEFLKGKPPKATATVQGDNNVTVTNSEDANVIVYAPVYHIAGNAYFHEQVTRTIRPLRKADRMFALEQDRQPLYATASSQYPSIASNPLSDIQPINTNTIEATLRVRQPHLDGEDSWRFSWGRNVITAKVEDQAFMEKVNSGAESFRAGDQLRVKLRIEEQQKGKNITKKHFIDEVLRHEHID